MVKRIKAPLYTKGMFGKKYREISNQDTEFLYSSGKYPTKIKAEDLPEDYIQIQNRAIWYLKGYLKTSGIIDMKYKWAKINHLFKDDYLYISYKEPLQTKEIFKGKGLYYYCNFDVSICGNDIIPVLLAAEYYSDYDISEIKQQIEEKRIWLKEKCPDDYVKMFGNKDVDLFEIYKRN